MTAHPIGTEISCDGPDEQTDCPHSAAISARFGSITARQVRADGRTDGWTTRRRNGRLADLCPNCRTHLLQTRAR
jgi:hypothetical protein